MERLRQVFGELRAHTVRAYVAFPRYSRLFGPDGSAAAYGGPEPVSQNAP